MTTLNNAMKHCYTKGIMNEDGFMVLTDMHRILTFNGGNKDKSIEYVKDDYDCTIGDATNKVEWALSLLTA